MTEIKEFKNLDWFIEHQEELLKLYYGMWLAIVDGRLMATFETQSKAETWIRQHFRGKSYGCYQCIPGREAYTIGL